MGTIHEVHSINKPRSKPMWVTPIVEGKALQMELDTGASVSLISWNDYKRLFNRIKLSKSSISMKAFTGHNFEIKEKINVCVEYEGNTHQLDLYVHSDSERNPVLGRKWLYEMQLNWNDIKTVKITSEVKPSKLR
uniref:Uncharacterized protein LOC102804012 n=1 Tax=Saccoglossus kowalevskii TaxID=10224 RepID=A0ABM0ME04_SACKO|nr:PREDICTED: uncharacterized protein LOC102804012 [Saccoglossus kowalevskii]